MSRVDFWYEFSSTYSYLSAMQVAAAAEATGVELRWRPFLLGPVFKDLGWDTSPFNVQAAKGANMWRDLARQAEGMGIGFKPPQPFPQRSLLAARVALIGHDEAWGAEFARAVFAAEFAQGLDIAEPAVIARILTDLGQDGDAVMARATADANKLRLRAQTDEAVRIGLFGAPSFVTVDGELFWGNDRLEQALHWAKHGSLSGMLVPAAAQTSRPTNGPARRPTSAQ